MAATIYDIAKVSNISVTTISKYFNGHTVRASTKQKIEDAIKELNYVPNSLAKSLVTQKSNTIGILLPFISNMFCSEIVQVFCREVRRHGYGVLLCECDGKKANELPGAKFLAEKMVAGILSMPYGDNPDFLDFCNLKKIPVVILDNIVQNVNVDCVLSENSEVCYNVTSMLLDRGHTKIAIIHSSPRAATHEKLLGYYKAFSDHNIDFDPELAVECNFNFDKAYATVTRLLQTSKPTAIFATNYDMTLGSLKAINDFGLKIGEDIAFVGFDNFDLVKVISPTISVVEQSVEKIGIAAAQTIIKRINGDYSGFPSIQRIPTILHITDSIGK